MKVAPDRPRCDSVGGLFVSAIAGDGAEGLLFAFALRKLLVEGFGRFRVGLLQGGLKERAEFFRLGEGDFEGVLYDAALLGNHGLEAHAVADVTAIFQKAAHSVGLHGSAALGADLTEAFFDGPNRFSGNGLILIAHA